MITATVGVIMWVKFRSYFRGILSAVCRLCKLHGLRYIYNIMLASTLFLLLWYLSHLRGTARKPTSYIVDTTGCRIPDLDPWDPLVLKYVYKAKPPFCNTEKPLLVNSNLTTLFIVPDAIPAYIKSNQYLKCCYRIFWRHSPVHITEESDKIISPTCISFENEAVIHDDYVMVQCYVDDKEVFRDYYAFIQTKPDVEARCEYAASKMKTPDYSLLIIGIDGMSRNHFIRDMPRTVQVLREMSAIDMAGDNVVGRHTLLNLIPALTGLTIGELVENCWPKTTVEFDLCPWIFKNFSKAGFRTAYGENLPHYSMFINKRAGFRVQPTDYYLQPAISLQGSWKTEHVKKICFGSRTDPQVLVEFMNKFVTMMRSKRFFSFFWDAHLTFHEYNIHPSYDIMYSSFLREHLYSGLFNRTILIVLSDHGYRWGDIRKTFQGLHEQRNPFMFFVFPHWFRSMYSIAIKNIYNNTRSLITAFDLHETLKDLLHHEKMLPNNVCENRTKKLLTKHKLPRGISLFLAIPKSRTCKDAHIDENLCLCQERTPLNVNYQIVKDIASVLINDLRKLVSPYTNCSTMQLQEVHSAWMHRQNTSILQSMDDKFKGTVVKEMTDLVDYTIIIQTKPGDAMFEATYRYRSGSWNVLSSFQRAGDIQRINLYGKQGDCIDDPLVRPYCHCKHLEP